jgi:hypothetical protein
MITLRVTSPREVRLAASMKQTRSAKKAAQPRPLNTAEAAEQKQKALTIAVQSLFSNLTF